MSVAKEVRRKEYAGRKEQGAHERKDKPQVHVEDVNHHSGRPHPPATRLSDSKILGGKLRKSDNV